MIISCKDATQIASLAQEKPLSLGERLRLRLHLLFCRGCRRAVRQFSFLRQASHAWKPGRD